MASQTQRQVDWLLRKGSLEEAVPAGQFMAFDDEHWRATIERVDIGDGLRIYLTKAEVRRSLSLEPVQTVSGIWLCTQVAVRGRVSVSLADGVHFRLSPDRSMLFRPLGGKGRFTPPPRQTLHLAGYMLRSDRVASLCDDDIPVAIRHLIEPEPESMVVAVRNSPHLRRVATRMLSDQFTGVLRPVYLEGLALQLFAIQCAVSGIDARDGHALKPGERAAVREARERLVADMTDPPTVSALARAVGMSERRLNAGFKALFGTTVFETLRNERLEHARIVLESEDLPLKIVAARVGYRHVSNFISAFTARYGAPPRQFAGGVPASPD